MVDDERSKRKAERRRRGEFPDADVIKGSTVNDGVNPSDEWDDEIVNEMKEFRDNLYAGLDDMLNKNRPAIWRLLREGRRDELLRAIGILDRSISNMEKSAYLVRNIGDSSEFTERYSLPSTFFRKMEELEEMIRDGETKGALMCCNDLVDIFKRYRRVSITSVTRATSEVSKYLYCIDELRVVQSILRDVRFVLKEDKALMLSDSDYEAFANIAYKLLVKKLMDKNDDIVVPEDIGDISDDVEKFLDSHKHRSMGYKQISWKKRMYKLIDEYFSDEFAKPKTDLTDEEVAEMKEKFGEETVDQWLDETMG